MNTTTIKVKAAVQAFAEVAVVLAAMALAGWLVAATIAVAISADAPAPGIYYAPGVNLERIDVPLIGSAQVSIDMAAYVLTDVPVIRALKSAAERGVAVRIYRERTQLHLGGQFAQREVEALEATPGVEMRVKRQRALMHLKSYLVDGKVLRAGAANFSASGLKDQDNDLIVSISPEAIARFKAAFALMWER